MRFFERSQQILELTWVYFLAQIHFKIQTFSPFPKLIIESFCIRKLVVDMTRKKVAKLRCRAVNIFDIFLN